MKRVDSAKHIKKYIYFENLTFLEKTIGGTYETRNGMKEPDHFGETNCSFTHRLMLHLGTSNHTKPLSWYLFSPSPALMPYFAITSNLQVGENEFVCFIQAHSRPSDVAAVPSDQLTSSSIR
ncbi:unnamed protein product [Acanthoscelides obtectus]|uniref:Uncharacterized protein n=1 Tax=Acanthoscelides obtectus TaxID=200917 RepID=A0A9P0LPU2_ACAOB|nr:unnamed protein product [Acanthoscelides obtectus]CAK1662763.1 hypothetical protein AOBTE_LOCUS23296 [Acanthoscelides obtectus]